MTSTKFKEGSIVTTREAHDYLGLSKFEAGEINSVFENEDGTFELDVDFFHNDRDSIIVDSEEVKLIAPASAEVSVEELKVGDKIIGINMYTGKLAATKVKAVQWVEEWDSNIIVAKDFYLLVDEGEIVTKVLS